MFAACLLFSPGQADHTEKDVGLLYELDGALLERVPNEVGKCMTLPFRRSGAYHMVRQPGLSIVQELKAIQKQSRAEREANVTSKRVFAVRGPRGTGKSATLHYLAQYARQNGWLLLATNGHEFPCEKLGFIKQSPDKEGHYNQALYSSAWLDKMCRTNESELKQISLKGSYDYNWNIPDVTFAEKKTLYDFAMLAAKDPTQSVRLTTGRTTVAAGTLYCCCASCVLICTLLSCLCVVFSVFAGSHHL